LQENKKQRTGKSKQPNILYVSDHPTNAAWR
jgi:hypothetical protein